MERCKRSMGKIIVDHGDLVHEGEHFYLMSH